MMMMMMMMMVIFSLSMVVVSWLPVLHRLTLESNFLCNNLLYVELHICSYGIGLSVDNQTRV